MARRIVRSLVLLSIIAGGGLYWYQTSRPAPIVLTGVVTTHDVIVSPQVTGRLTELLVEEGDTVAANAVLARLDANELTQDRAFYAATALSVGSQVQESAAALRFQERLVGDQVAQAEATLAATESQIAAAQAELDNAQRTAQRADDMARQGVVATEDLDRARTARDVAQAKLASLRKQVDAARSAVALARTNAEQIAIRKSQLDASVQQRAAATAQRAKADVRLAYTELRAPVGGIIDVRAARAGEIVAAGQPVVTLVNPDDLWVRINVEESYVERVRIGDRLPITLPGGSVREGTVYFRGVEAGYATQRDVSRTKRDIKTFEVRLRVDNADRRLAVGMTAYVTLPL